MEKIIELKAKAFDYIKKREQLIKAAEQLSVMINEINAEINKLEATPTSVAKPTETNEQN